MDVIYGLIPMVLFFGFLVVVVFIWMAKKGQFDDLDGAAHSIFLIDDDDDIESSTEDKAKKAENPGFDEKREEKKH
jgi:cbb3-type cytochrome oxidase maturation protein